MITKFLFHSIQYTICWIDLLNNIANFDSTMLLFSSVDKLCHIQTKDAVITVLKYIRNAGNNYQISTWCWIDHLMLPVNESILLAIWLRRSIQQTVYCIEWLEEFDDHCPLFMCFLDRTIIRMNHPTWKCWHAIH